MALPELDGEGLLKLFTLAHASGARTALDTVSYTHLTLPTNREV